MVTIFGANFDSNNIQNNVVYFGSTKAEVISATFGTLEVIVPVGASTAPISVTNQCDRTAYSKVSFNGIFCPTPLDNQTYNNRSFDLPGVYGAYNMLSQDLDLDGKPEVVSSGNGGGLTIAINNSTPGVLNFTALNSNAGGQSIYAADFDGDGYKDLLSTYQVTRNTSTLGNVSMAASLAIPRVSSYQIAAGDFNNDGKIDIVGEDGNIVWVAFNTSSGVGNISFGPRQSLGNVGTRCTGIQVADIDGDGKTDFIASQGPANRAVSIRNTTAVGSMTPSSEAPEYWASDSNPNDGTGTYPYRAQIADFDKDGKIDFTSCNYQGATNVAIWRNISTVGNIQFAPTVNLDAPTANYRIGVGDVDGDGYPDIVTKSLGQNVFSVYKNTTSSEGAPTFATRIDYTSSWQAEVSGIVIGDLDGDYVPDIATSGISSNRILFHRNTSSQNDDTAPNAIAQDVVVALTPNGTVTVTAAQVNNGSSDACGIDSIVLSQTVFTCADIGENQVTLTVTDNAGNVSTAQAIVNVQPAAIIVAGQTTVCQGETIPLTANVGDSYQWFNNGQPIDGATSQNYTATISGAYTVAVTNAGGCSGTSLATEVTVNNNPVVEITGRTEAYCPGESLLATQSSIYQWYKNGASVANATLREFFPDGPGVYTVEVIDLFGCSASGSVTINPDTQAPTISLNGAAQITVDSDTQFNDPGATAEDNCSTTIEVSSNLDLSTPGVYTVSYTAVDGSGNRSTTITREVTVLDATPPVVNAGRVTVELDENGQVSVDPASLNNGSTDNGNGALTFTLDVSTFTCDDLNGNAGATPINMTGLGTANLNNYSVGAGYNPNNGEFWMPQWSGTTVYRIDQNGAVLGTFNSGANLMMQLWIDQDSETEYYTSHWSSRFFSKRNTSGQEIWRYVSPSGREASGISTDADFVYVTSYYHNQIEVLDKATGQFVRAINLPGRIYMYGGLVVANERFYLAGQTENWSSRPNNWNTIHELDMNGNYLSSIATTRTAYNAFFDGEVIWTSDFGTINDRTQISDGNAYAGGGGIEVLLTGTDAAGNSASAVGVVVVLDNLAPTVTLNGDQVVQLVTGSTFNDAGATANDNCSATVETSGSVNVNAAGSYTLTYKATDGSGNESAEITRTVNVIDLVVNTKNVTVELDQNGNYTLTPSEVDNGSVLAGGDLSLDITSFTCSNIGQNVVTLTATSASGITASGTATVTVVDLIAPAIALNGNASLTHEAYTSYVDAGATTTDNCSATLVTTSNVDVNALGSYTVTFTSTDASGNETIASRTVTVVDSVDPIAQAKDVTVTLDDNGNASVSTADVDNGSSDNSGSVSLSLNQTTFACSDFGTTVQVILTATDAAGNTSSANANVTVTGVDTDGDGFANPCDLDDDNDGILDTIECSSSAFFWSDGPALQNPVNGLATSARGTINGIGYTYSSNVNFRTTGDLFGINKFPAEFAIPNQTSIRNDLASQNTLTFDQPMTNPVLVFASIGGGPTVNIEFENDFDVLWIETGTTSVNGRVVTGKEGNIVLRFNGTFSELNFDYLNDETYVNFAFGADFFSLCDFDEDGITNNLDLDSDNDGCVDAVEGALGLGLAAINAEGRLIASVDANGVPISANGGQGVGTSANASVDCECELKIDQDAPVITAPANISVFATSAAGAVVNYSVPVGTDACDVTTVLTAGFGSGATFPIGTTTVTYTATDGSGNTASASFNVEVSGLAPEIVVPANITVSNDTDQCGAIVNFAATDATGIPASTITYDLQPGTYFPVGTTTVTATATNAVGVSIGSFTVNVVDDEAPEIGGAGESIVFVDPSGDGVFNSADQTRSPLTANPSAFGTLGWFNSGGLKCFGNSSGNYSGAATFEGLFNINSSGTFSTAMTFAEGDIVNTSTGSTGWGIISNLPVGTHNVAFRTASNRFGYMNLTYDGSNITINRSVINPIPGEGIVIGSGVGAPDITVNTDLGNCGAVVEFNVDSEDNCSSVVTYSHAPGSFFPVGTTTVTATATDPSGNTATATFEVTVIDNIAPVITAPADINVFATSASGAVVNYTAPVGTDNCSVTTALTAGLADGATFPIGTTVVTYTATDASGLTASASFNVIVTGLPPQIVVPADITVSTDAGVCGAVVNYLATETTAIPSSTITYDIQPGSFFAVGTTTVTATAVNPVGTSVKSFTVTVNDTEAPIVITQDFTVDLDVNGNASITVADINAGSGDNCGVANIQLDKTSFTCSNVGANTVTLTVTDIHGNSASESAVVTVRDVIAAEVITTDITIELDVNGNASITTGDIDNGSNDACGIASYSLDKTTFDCSNVGANTVTLTVTDNNGNVSSNTAQVTVRDVIAAEVITTDITIDLDVNGNASITTGDIDNGSNDACGIASYSLDKTTFDCSNVGANTVILTVTDNNGNVSSNTAQVTVRDVIAAEVITTDITIDLDVNGNASITTGDIDNGSNDACGIASYSLDKTTFDCTNVGANTVTLTVTDNNGNVRSNTAQVTVRDVIAAEVITTDITIDLDVNGNASITTGDIDNGSNDACGIASYSLDKTTFDCTNVGANTVTLTVTDNNGNVSSNTAQVTVRDVIAAEVITQDITVELDANGSASITTGMIDNGSNDACGIASYALDITSFDCSNTGANTVTLTVTDVNGNVSSSTAQVTVIDVIAPTVITKDIEVFLDENGAAS
ncbi:MAG: hypothetical protein COW03_13460, partial [Cytophagales bacterium CG12_big_fil_rev_8_21_14_0_65_40_12]